MAPDHDIEETEELHCALQLSLKPPHTCNNLLSSELNCQGYLLSGSLSGLQREQERDITLTY